MSHPTEEQLNEIHANIQDLGFADAAEVYAHIPEAAPMLLLQAAMEVDGWADKLAKVSSSDTEVLALVCEVCSRLRLAYLALMASLEMLEEADSDGLYSAMRRMPTEGELTAEGRKRIHTTWSVLGDILDGLENILSHEQCSQGMVPLAYEQIHDATDVLETAMNAIVGQEAREAALNMFISSTKASEAEAKQDASKPISSTKATKRSIDHMAEQTTGQEQLEIKDKVVTIVADAYDLMREANYTLPSAYEGYRDSGVDLSKIEIAATLLSAACLYIEEFAGGCEPLGYSESGFPLVLS